ncbi:phage major tail tube protein [Sphingobium lignivorans]|uniref:Phage major tail tube protein n=1 Tax=Sphingobium lignivorans TaxID=2735886 RepID=A0ABR6NDI7_9SPHN|nr:phage major tail tube protein [Sphingobium lignivorans]MBB5985320.1 hypothetical protein [Sphingobium lignivorans]
MGLPPILKNMNGFLDGVSLAGAIAEVTIPTLARTFEDYRGGGMDGNIGIDMGQENIEFEWKLGGHITAGYGSYAAQTHDATMIRWVGAYQDDGTGLLKVVEIVVRGRHQEIAPGTGKAGEKSEETFKTRASFYQMSVDGAEIIYIDIPNMVCRVNGNDRMAEMRAALGI